MTSSEKLTWIIAAIIVLTSGCSESNRIIPPQTPEGDTLTTVFQDGVSPDQYYRGTRDAILKDAPNFEIRNGNFGGVRSDTLGTVIMAGASYERRLIMRFDLTSITSCAWVYSARISIRLEPNAADTMILDAYEATVPAILPSSWPEGSGVMGEGVSWHAADGVVPWTNEGGDYDPLLLDAVAVSSDSTAVFELLGPLVLRWIRYPGENNGVIVKSRYTSQEQYRIVHLRESEAPELRPTLLITYMKGGG